MNTSRLKLRNLVPQKHYITSQEHLISKKKSADNMTHPLVPQLKSHTKRVTQNSMFCDTIQEVLGLDQRVGLLDTMTEVMRHSKVKSKNWKVNRAIKRIQTHNITELNSLLYAYMYVAKERMGMKRKESRGKRTKEPFWKREMDRDEHWYLEKGT